MKKNVIFVLCLLMMTMCYKKTEALAANLNIYKEAAVEDEEDDVLDGLVKEDGYYYYYKDGEMVTKKWISQDGRKYYFQQDGKAATDIIVIDEKFCCFGKDGNYNKQKTKKIRKAAKYEKPFANLQKIIGKPNKSKYYESCRGNGKDGILKYDSFIVYTFKPAKGKEIFIGAQ